MQPQPPVMLPPKPASGVPPSVPETGVHSPAVQEVPTAQSSAPSSTVPSQSSSTPLQLSADSVAAAAHATPDVPSHWAAQAPSPLHAVRPPRGAPVTAEQVPTLPASAQASHWPSQARSQQVPSTQKPLAHWGAALHVAPDAWGAAQTPAEHQLPAAQSESAAQFPTHAEAPQAKAPHACVCSGGQPPWPSHPAESTATPAAQLPGRQVTAAPG